MPCRQTIRKLIVDGYKVKKVQIIEELAAVNSRFSLTTDMWKASARKQSYLVITLHWIDNQWKLRNVILDFRYIPRKHSGENMKDTVMETLREFKVAHRIFGATTVKAPNMVMSSSCCSSIWKSKNAVSPEPRNSHLKVKYRELISSTLSPISFS